MSRNVKMRKKLVSCWKKLSAMLIATVMLVTTTCSINNLTYADNAPVPIADFKPSNVEIKFYYEDGEEYNNDEDVVDLEVGEAQTITAKVTFTYDYTIPQNTTEVKVPVHLKFESEDSGLRIAPLDSDNYSTFFDDTIIFTKKFSAEELGEGVVSDETGELSYRFLVKANNADVVADKVKCEANINGYYSDDENSQNPIPSATFDANGLYTLRFETNGGNDVDTQYLNKYRETLEPDPAPTKAYYTFAGWYADSEFNTPFEFGHALTDHTTVYAKWTFNAPAQPKNGDDADAATKAAAAEVTKLIEAIAADETVDGLTDEQVAMVANAIENDNAISITVNSKKVDEGDVQEDAEKVKKAIGNTSGILAFYDINVNLLIDGNDAGNITKLGNKITITLDLPTNLPDIPTGYTRKFKVIRVHDGVATELDTTINGNTFSFDSDEFSTYALTYTDVKEETASDEEEETSSDSKEGTTTNDASNGKSSTINPKTGDTSMILWVGFVIISMLLAIISMKSIKNKANN